MPKKRYDDEALRRKALELRKLGMSYREIAKELGCSVYKAHQLISQPQKAPITPSSIQQLDKDLRRLKAVVASQSIKVKDIEAKVKDLETRLKDLGDLILELTDDLFRLKGRN